MMHIFSLIVIYFANLISQLEAQDCGFSVDLINRNSKSSPLPPTSHTPLDHFNNGFPRAVSRLRRLLGEEASDVQREAENGEHIMTFSIGTPPQVVHGIVDTGSDLFWTQCQPCQECYNQTNPIYNPKSSSSYVDIDCKSPDCKLLDTTSCSPESHCNYKYGYGDNSLTKGVLGKETVTFPGGASVENIVFGCGRNNTGVFYPRESGLVGLGGRPFSFAHQVGKALGNKKFSYCLTPVNDPESTSKMHFGSAAEIPPGPDVVTVPLVTKEDKTPYFVTVTGMSVGASGKVVPYTASGSPEKGNMFIDSGVPPTLVPEDLYKRLQEELKKSFKDMTPLEDPDLKDKFCYKTEKMGDEPMINIHFEGDRKVAVPAVNTFIPAKAGVFCLGMESIDAKVGVYGNYLQSNYRIVFDLDKHQVSFKKANCSEGG
ncbi:Eukaryotic aspartyl protease family protein [Euphorbia peplus]|nr:Eukaryotic aspartyl protease family protein [Euphorbia peplus]